mgnify:CR=1 FL=1
MIEMENFYIKVFLKMVQEIGNSIGVMEKFQKKENIKLGEKMEFGKNIEKMEV